MPQQVFTPLRNAGEGEGPETPEALLISALLESGEFTPQRFHLSQDDLSCWGTLWTFCTEYQERAGSAPPMDLVRTKYPEYTFTAAVDLGWAVHQMHRASAIRKMRKTLAGALDALNDDNVEAAQAAIETIERPRTMRRPPISVWEHPSEASFDVSRLPVPYVTLGRATGGIGPGELWYISARPSHGKTYTICEYVKWLLTGGYFARYVSLEMPAATINRRVLRCTSTKEELALLDSNDPYEHKRGIDMIHDRVPGRLEVIDPSHGKATNSLVYEQMQEAEAVLVDHVGLMRTTDGRRAIDDWRAMAQISNQLKEDALATSVPVVAAAQLNRKAETNSSYAPKAGETMSQSDALLQDGDVVVTMKRLSKRVMVHSGEKVREGEDRLRWWSVFDPKNANFAEISQERAQVLRDQDGDFEQ